MKLSDIEMSTQQHIKQAAQAEFLSKGFKDASLRSIVKNAGVTTGAFYGYYKSKEALFEALVDTDYQAFLKIYQQAQTSFQQLDDDAQLQSMNQVSKDCMEKLIGYMYEHLDSFRLLLCCKDGTRYEGFIHELIKIETEATHRFFDVLRRTGQAVNEIDPLLEHMIISAFFSGYFEVILHQMPKQQALTFVKELSEFYSAGWNQVMGL